MIDGAAFSGRESGKNTARSGCATGIAADEEKSKLVPFDKANPKGCSTQGASIAFRVLHQPLRVLCPPSRVFSYLRRLCISFAFRDAGARRLKSSSVARNGNIDKSLRVVSCAGSRRAQGFVYTENGEGEYENRG